MKTIVNIQITKKLQDIPNKNEFYNWIRNTTKKAFNITIKIVSKKEITFLNKKYKNKNTETNVLTFKYEANTNLIIGDIILCANVINKEAEKLKINKLLHWSHMTIHGTLHLLNYTHESLADTINMKNLEIKIIKSIFIHKKK
ncbi:MAG TPA: rRNA maturation RNase YbeY [Candidatus Azoamicus sp. OHIO1]